MRALQAMRSPTSSRDEELDELPSVPRVSSVNRPNGKLPASTKPPYRNDFNLDRRRLRVPVTPSSRSSSPLLPTQSRRARTKKGAVIEDDDEDADNIELNRNTKDTSSSEKASSAKSPSPSESVDNSNNSDETDDSKDNLTSRLPSEDDHTFTEGPDDLIAQLEKENDREDSDEFDSSGDSRAKDSSSQSTTRGRLTMRQRALQGEKIELAYGKLASPKHKKRATPPEDWTPDEQKELQKEQKARVRKLINEKRNKEKRAATVDKVLRGVTSKRKKLNVANEAQLARSDPKLNNIVQQGFVRYVSGPAGSFVSVSDGSALPTVLSTGLTKAVYPQQCTRDPKTGKRIFTC